MNTEKKLYQWDTGQKLTGCTGLYVDFPIDNEVYRVETADGTCIIPDELLQTSGGHKVYECMTNNTIRSFAFSVTPRPKPPDYVYTSTERLTFEGLVQKVDDAVADMIRRAESGEFDGHTPVKGTDYFTTSEIQQIQNEVSSGAIGEFKSVVDTETETFNNNAETKLNAYNQNDSQKTASYNANATKKLNAYNANANNRVAEFDAHTEQIQTDIGELKSELGDLGDTIGFANSYNADVLVSTTESTTTYLDVDISPQKQYNMTISVKSGTIEANRPIHVNVYYGDESYASGKYQIYKDRVYSFVEEKQVVRLSIWIANAPNEAELLFSLEPISKFENIKKYVDDSIEHTNVLHGKKLYCGGDSITEAVNVGSFDNGYKKSYGGIVAYRNNMEYVSDGVGGSTIGLCKIDGAYTNNFIQSRYKNIPTDAGYITLWFGWNDNAYGWKSKRDEYCVSNYGTYYSALTDEQKAEVDTTNWRTWLNQYIADKDSTDITTWCGAWNTVLDWILENCPNAHVGVCIGYGVDDSFKQPIIDVCKKHGVPYLKCYDSNDCFSVGHSDGISASVATQRKSLYTLDNTHPNELGYEMISTSYEQFLKRI